MHSSRHSRWRRDPSQPASGESGAVHRVDRVGLDLGMRDQTHLARIGDDNSPDVGRHDRHDGRCVAGRLHHHVVVMRQSSGERLEMIPRHADAAQSDDLALIQHHRLGEHAMDIQAYDPHRSVSLPYCLTSQELAGNTATTDPRSQRIRASRRGGQIKARAHSPGFWVGLPALACSQRPMSRMVSP
jgi:hypothetical protein